MKTKGFTLIELLITVAILGILTGVAYPAYSGYMKYTRRADAKAVLMTIYNKEESAHAASDTYVGIDDERLAYTVPAEVTKYYTIEIAALQNTFTATASPTGVQAGDTCGSFTINERGSKTPTTAGCW